MSVESKMVEGKPTCRITGDMRIWEAAEIWQKIHPMITLTKPFAVDLSTVASCDGAGIQIICQLLHAVRDQRMPITFLGISDPILAAMRLAGFDDDAIKMIKGDG